MTRERTDDEQLRDLGRRIAELREAKGLTQEGLAGDANLEPRHLQRIETGHQNTSIKTLLKVGRALGVSVVDLFVIPRPRPKPRRGRPKRRTL